MTERDAGRARFYEAEHLVHRLFDNVSSSRTVRLAGTEVTLPAEVRFASIDAGDDCVRRVLASPGVRSSFERASQPVSVRERRGQRSAHYAARVRRSDGVAVGAEIAIPATADGRWALRELVVLHELAHHLDGTRARRTDADSC